VKSSVAKTTLRNVTLPALANYRRRTGAKAGWPCCAACSRFTLKPAPMYSVNIGKQGDRFLEIIGVCKVHGEECLRIDFERRYSPGEMSTAWRQLVFHEGEIAR
jgi:hypothetical protein